MVAASPIAPQTPEEESPPDFSRYSRPVDRTRVGFEGTPGRSTPVPVVWHEAFKPRRSLSVSDRKELAIKQAALRIAAGLEPRSLRELAKDIGCSHTAIDNCVRRFCERLGMRKFHVSEETRERLRAARRRQAQSRMSAVGLVPV